MTNASPDQVYGYLNPTIDYCYEDPEGYLADYPDSDVLSERSHEIPLTSERKQRIPHPASHELYTCDLYHSPENFYYETLPPVPPPIRRPRVPFSYRPSIPLVDDRRRYYTPPVDADFRDHEVYGASQMRMQSAPQPRISKVTQRIGRRHSVAVRTPRYFRRTVSNVCKKPSALCLPISCQPDPAVCRRSKKHHENAAYHYLPCPHVPAAKHLSRRHSLPMQTSSALDKSGDKELHMTQSDVDAVLARYETICKTQGADYPTEKCDSISSKDSKVRKFKPKTPPSLKKNNEKNKQGQPASVKPTAKIDKRLNVESLEVEEITPEVLDSMLSDLINSGRDNKLDQNKIEPNKPLPRTFDSKAAGEGATLRNVQKSTKPIYNSFNYQDIANNISKTQSYVASAQAAPPSTPKSSKADVTNTNFKSERIDVSDENGIMELHRSKSYIVSLIDRALSKELGTATDDSYPPISKEVNQVNARQAAGTVKKHDRKCENGLCLEITQSLNDSLGSNGGSTDNDIKHEVSCACNVQEEPLYIKQLRQLRWGHLKHIQMEVRRLEDLERFLDSCSAQQSK